MVKALAFKGDAKKSRKRKRPDASQDLDSHDTGHVTSHPEAQDVDDDTWVTADVASDVRGPIVMVLPSDPPTCLACDGNGQVFTSVLENLIEGNPTTAEPHDVRQVWVAHRIVGTDTWTFRGHHKRYVPALAPPPSAN